MALSEHFCSIYYSCNLAIIFDVWKIFLAFNVKPNHYTYLCEPPKESRLFRYLDSISIYAIVILLLDMLFLCDGAESQLYFWYNKCSDINISVYIKSADMYDLEDIK